MAERRRSEAEKEKRNGKGDEEGFRKYGGGGGVDGRLKKGEGKAEGVGGGGRIRGWQEVARVATAR